ncbi:Nudix family hydrolase [Marinobacter adhaerens]|uniref:8-oxo-dGTP diphosphatase n=1 Tax=Marinobacter adhaerens TaxID=1033846 RepID=A0A851HSP5_9GAMM|nr:Nudix family hydrolase [Marinobacter adhaerens]NWN92424.1 Nudix family hydrolase [Marinobacter adhaerens]
MTVNVSEVREIHVAVGVIVRDGYVLIARRPEHAHQGGLLEFPGGKVEPGETVQAALVREIAEETGLQLSGGALDPLICIHHDYGDKRVVLDVWRTDQAGGEAHGREGQAIRWVRPESLQDEEFPAANRPIIRALKLPSLLAITGAFESDSAGPEQLRTALTQFFGTGCDGLVVLRVPGLSREAYATFAKNCLESVGSKSHRLLVHGEPGVFTDNPGAAGLHMPWREASKLDARPVPDGVWLGVSCHSAGEIDHAVAIGADYVTLGPVKPTATHPGAPALGWDGFRDLVAHASVPVFGLGGLYPEDLRRAQLAGAQGVAGIRFWWPQTES